MNKRSLVEHPQQWLLSPGLKEAPVLDLMCSHFVLNLAARQGAKFNVRRDLTSLLSLSGRHLVWPLPALQRLREFLGRRCKGNEFWQDHETLSDAEFMARHGVWRGPYEEGTLFFYLDEHAKDQPKDLLSVLSATGDWLTLALKKQSTLVEKNIESLASLLQLNRAERALLLYGTLARYQRDLRSLLVEFKVNNAPEAYAAIADVAGVKAPEVAEALRPGSRLERIGMVENLISEHNITDLADLMKVSEKLPPVLMRKYRDHSELMAVFTRPATRSLLGLGDFAFVQDDAQVLVSLLRNAVAAKEPGVNVLLYGPPGTGKTELAKVVAQAAGLDLFEVEYADQGGNSLSGRDRYRSLQIAQVFLKGSMHSALLFDEVEDVFPPISNEAAQLMARSEQLAAPASGSVSGKAWVNQILESNAVPTLWVTNRIEQIDPAFRRRFAYHLELRSPPPGAREGIVRKTLEGVQVSDAFIAKLTARKGLTPAQIRTAVRFARLASAPDKGVDTPMGIQPGVGALSSPARAAGPASPDRRRSAPSGGSEPGVVGRVGALSSPVGAAGPASPDRRRSAPSGGSEPGVAGSVGALSSPVGAAGPASPDRRRSAPSGGSEPGVVGSVGALSLPVGAAGPASPDRRRSAPSGGSEPHEVGSVGASIMESLIERQLKNADVALGNKAEAGGRRNVTTYDLAMLNVESRFEISRIVQALKSRGHGSLCFYGPPGTGKTALAEHIAQALEQPLLIKQASDLMSKYVGETEQHMATMFREAETEKAVLLLDEADSFLQDRRGAQRTYEVTEVNEMLQGMERYNGIFICTTNLFDSLDQAALRRFTFKIRFMPLNTGQREAMFVAEALAGDASRLTDALQESLAQLAQLCPGDFAAVKRQGVILDAELSAEEFLLQLEAEHRLKPEVREARRMGFMR